MALTVNAKTSGSDLDNNRTHDTASFTPTNGDLLLVYVVWLVGFGTLGSTSLSGQGQAFTTEKTVSQSSLWRQTLFSRLNSGTSAGVLTITTPGTIGGSEWCAWAAVEVHDSGGGSPYVVQSASNTASSGTSLTATLAAFADAVNNLALGWFWHEHDEVNSPGAGFTEVYDLSGTSNDNADEFGVEVEKKTGQDTSVDASWATSSNNGGIAAEIGITPSATAAAILPAVGNRSLTLPAISGAGVMATLDAEIKRLLGLQRLAKSIKRGYPIPHGAVMAS